MAYLLGSEACISSLKRDVQDLQWAVHDIFSRTGPINAFSWKFPDKQAADVDIEDLLDLYDCSEEEDDAEERQIAHIALYELVIDRLLLLIQSTSKFVDINVNCGNIKLQETPTEKGPIGLIVKQFWNQMISLQSGVHQTVSEKNSATSRSVKLERDVHKLSEGQNPDEKAMTALTPGTLGLIPPNTADTVFMGIGAASANIASSSISKEINNKACQTYETAFVPCESCDVVQRKMKEAGDMVIKVCTDQGLPSSLKKFKSQLMHVEWLSFSDICRWMAEQNKDIGRVGKQNELLQSTISPLKDEVKSCKRRTLQAEDTAKKCEKSVIEEKETQSILRKQIQAKMKEQEDKHLQVLCQEERQKGALKNAKEKLETEVEDIRSNLDNQRRSLKQLEASYKTLQEDLEIKQKEAERSGVMSKELAEVKVHLSEVTTQLEENSRMLAREQGKNRSANKHTESLQSKQDNLLARMEALGSENEELNQQVLSLEEEKAAFDDEISELKVEAKELRKRVKENEIVIKNLSNDKDILEEVIKKTKNSMERLGNELKETQERERMMVEYPDLNGPVNTDLRGSGDIALDMSNQVKANRLRISLLEGQNQGLEESIWKINSMRGQSQASTRETPPHHPVDSAMNPVPLWNKGDSLAYASGQDDQQFKSDSTHRERPSSHSSSSAANPNHKNGKQTYAKVNSINMMAPVNASSIGAYKQMKSALGISAVGKAKGTSKKGELCKGRPPSGNSEKKFINMPMATEGLVDGRDRNVSTFSCPRCDKMYLKSRDLEIHLSYCAV